MVRLHPALRVALTAALAALLPFHATAQEDRLRVYRCVGSQGTVALQDAPCRSGEQQVRDLQRPRDPPPRHASSAPASSPPPPLPAREVRYVHVQPPQPMYECIDAEGDRYISDSNEGNPRWVPLWTTVWVPGHGRPPRPWHGGGQRPPGGPGHRPGGTVVHATQLPAGNILVRDTCTALPRQEVCARLRDRRWELDRRYNSALQSERDAIVVEQRGIDARLGQDCSGR